MSLDRMFDLFAELTDSQKSRVDKWINTSKKFPKRDIDFSDHIFGNKDRVTVPYIPDSENEDLSDGNINNLVRAHLHKHGYTISNPSKGHVKDKYGRQTTIGKALVKTGAPKEMVDRAALDLQKSNRKKNNLAITYTRDPYDVAGMSTDRGWRSCMNMTSKERYKRALKHDVREGTHVAYLHHKDDTDLKHPIARIALKPLKSKEGHAILRPEPSVYGSAPIGFEDQVESWTHEHFPLQDEEYHLPKNLYRDGVAPSIQKPIKDKEDAIEKLKHKNKNIRSKAANYLMHFHPDEIVKHSHLKIAQNEFGFLPYDHQRQLIPKYPNHPNWSNPAIATLPDKQKHNFFYYHVKNKNNPNRDIYLSTAVSAIPKNAARNLMYHDDRDVRRATLNHPEIRDNDDELNRAANILPLGESNHILLKNALDKRRMHQTLLKRHLESPRPNNKSLKWVLSNYATPEDIKKISDKYEEDLKNKNVDDGIRPHKEDDRGYQEYLNSGRESIDRQARYLKNYGFHNDDDD